MMSKRTGSKPKAYSYVRFSTPEQSKGDSERRQIEGARKYAEENGLTLDEVLTFEDFGVSAYRGTNAVTGMLGKFLAAVEDGVVKPGSFLLVESLDRISRDKAIIAQNTLQSIVLRDVNVVTLMDNQVYTNKRLHEDPMSIMYSLMVFMRANEESATKSRRLKSSWENKRERAIDGPITARAPAWLWLDRDSNEFRLIHKRVEVVRNIFTWTLEGMGQTAIMKKLNQSGVPVFGKGKQWHRTYIAKILQNRAVIGTFTPHIIEYVEGKKCRKPADSIQNYFPVVVEPETFFRVQVMAKGSSSSKRGRHAKKPIQNLFGTLARCPKCAGTMTRVNKGSRSNPKLVCVNAKNGIGCKYHSVSYEEAETAFLRRLPTILDNLPSPKAEASLDHEIEELMFSMDHLRDRLESLIDELSITSSPTIRGQVLSLENELERKEVMIRELRDRREATNGQLVINQAARLKEALKNTPENKDRLNELIRQTFRSIVINYEEGELDLYWPNGAVASVPLPSYDFA